jgi:transcription antitermination factor NusB
MKQREFARRIALQALFQLDFRSEAFGPETVDFLRSSTKDPEVYFFARRLTEGAWAWRQDADLLIQQATEHWDVDRMAVLDRNILRLASWEIACCDDIPDRVAIDQAIELAKRFGSAESGSFVNGVLDHVLRIVQAKREAGAAAAKETAGDPGKE